MSKRKKMNPYKIAGDIGKQAKKTVPLALLAIAGVGVKQGPKIIKKFITK